MMIETTIAADCETHCQCCGRKHRKLFLIDGGWVGKSCAEQVKIYRDRPEVTDIVWRGYERQHAKVAAFVTRGPLPQYC